MAKYAQRLIRAGAKFVGGCCGTTPEHIKRDRGRGARARRRGRITIAACAASGAAGAAAWKPYAARASARAAARRSPRASWSPPSRSCRRKGIDPAKMLAGVRAAEGGRRRCGERAGRPARADAHGRAADGDARRAAASASRAVVHYCCRDRNLLGMLSDLLGAHALGLRNLLLITGDPPKMGPYPEATAVFDIDSIGLTNLVNRLNRGMDPGRQPDRRADVVHDRRRRQPGAPDLEYELSRFYWKVEAGRRVRDHAAGLRPRSSCSRFIERDQEARHPDPDRRGHLAAGLASATPSSWPTKCPAWSCPTRDPRAHARASEQGQGARAAGGHRDRARDVRPGARRSAGRPGIGALRQGRACAAGVRAFPGWTADRGSAVRQAQ